MHYIIEGVDRLGKSTLIENIQKDRGPFMVVHYSKPLIKRQKNLFTEPLTESGELKYWQIQSFANGFKHLQNTDIPTIFDRFHLGETVYSPMYRNYSGNYIYNLEKEFDTSNIRMILLITSNFDFITDDGESFNFNAKAKEQDRFIEAFHKSNIKNKVIIDVHNAETNTFLDPNSICSIAVNPHIKSNTLNRKINNEKA